MRNCLFLLLWAVSLLAPNAVQSQNPCDDWAIEISAVQTFNISLPTGCSDNGPCGKIYYYVSLISKGEENDPSAKNKTFRFHSLSFNGMLGVTPNASVTQRALSYLDPISSQNCSPVEVNDPLSPIATASWESDGHFSYQYGPLDSPYELNLNVHGRRLLFVIAVNAYPGETVQPISYSGSFALISGTAPNLVTTNCNTVTTIGPLSRTQTEPIGCANNIPGLRFGQAESAGIAGFPNSKRVGVYLQGPSTYTVQDLDFLVGIKTEPAMANISILAGQLPATAITLYNESNDPKQKRAYVSIHNQNFPISTSPLFYIVINGPIASSGCADVELSLIGPRRIRSTQFSTQICCTLPQIGSNANVHFGSIPCTEPYCSKDLQLQVKKVTPFPTSGDLCSDLYFSLQVANTASTSTSYTSGTAVMDITHDGTLTNTSTNLPVFTPGPSLASVTYTVSVQIISSSLLRVTLNYSAATINLGPGISKEIGTFKLTGSNVCIQTIYFSDGTIDQGTCVVQSFATEVANTPGDDICIQSFGLLFQTQYQDPNVTTSNAIQDVTFSVPAGGCTFNGTSNVSGSAAACLSCATAGTYAVIPSLDINPLNGVTTYDLVLISQHILGVTPLANPYKMIAADANKSGSITAFDIVELRKLILGIYSKLPNNTSWRFVPKSFVFPTMGNPLLSGFTDFASITLPSSTPIQSEFYGIKIGDVNGTVLANDGDPQLSASNDREATTLKLNYALTADQRGETLEIPLFARQSAEVVAWQLALNYDPSQWRIAGVRWPAAATSRPHQLSAWNEPAPGELRLNWFDGDGAPIALNDQSPIAYLQVEQLGRGEISFQIAPTLSSEAYTADGRVLNYRLSAAPYYQNAPVDETLTKPTGSNWTANIYPNPASQEFRVEIRLPAGGDGTLTFFDLMGREVIRHKCLLSLGENVITSAQLPTLSTGLYMVRFDTPLGRQTLRFVKQ